MAGLPDNVDVQVIDGITIVTTYQEFDLAGSMAIL